jgi:phosphate transport system ATP-binding protein
LALEPEVLLLDEPCSGLDPISTSSIEETLFRLKKDYTIILVPHNIQQASRVADRAGFFLNGDLVEEGPVYQIFTKPRDKRTEDYVTGKFG